jgi:hypothetical protein
VFSIPLGRAPIEVGLDIFEILSNKLSIKCSLTSIALWMDQLWPSQRSTVGLPTNRPLNYDELALQDRSCSWHIHTLSSSSSSFLRTFKIPILGSNKFLILSLCKHRNELTLSLAFMGVFIGVMSSSYSPS